MKPKKKKGKGGSCVFLIYLSILHIYLSRCFFFALFYLCGNGDLGERGRVGGFGVAFEGWFDGEWDVGGGFGEGKGSKNERDIMDEGEKEGRTV